MLSNVLLFSLGHLPGPSVRTSYTPRGRVFEVQERRRVNAERTAAETRRTREKNRRRPVATPERVPHRRPKAPASRPTTRGTLQNLRDADETKDRKLRDGYVSNAKVHRDVTGGTPRDCLAHAHIPSSRVVSFSFVHLPSQFKDPRTSTTCSASLPHFRTHRRPYTREQKTAMASRPVVEPGAEDRRQNQTGRSGVSDPRARSSGDPQNARSTVQSDAAAGNRTTRRGADGAYRRPQPAQPRPGGSADEEVRR